MKTKKTEVIMVDYAELEKFLRKELELTINQYDFVSNEEARNNSYYLMRVYGKIDEWDKKDIEEVLKCSKDKTKIVPGISTEKMMDYLFSLNKLESGNYLVRVYW